FVGVSCFAWAVFDPRFHDTEGFLVGSFFLPVSVGLAMMVLGCAAAGRWKRSAFWFALALIGQAAALQLIDAGNRLHWQHYKPFHLMLRNDLPALLVVIMQTVIVLVGMRPRWNAMCAWLSQNLKWWQGLGIALVCVASAAAVQRDVRL